MAHLRIDYRDPDDASTVDAVTQQADPDERWQAARRRVLTRADLKCERCGAEDDRDIYTHVYWEAKWLPVVPGQPRPRPDLCVVRVKVIVVPKALPWSGEDEDLAAWCIGCWLLHEVHVANYQETGPTKGQQRLL